MKITIDRSKWRTGTNGRHATGKGDTYLRNAQGFQCCLGFVCEQANPDLNIDDIELPCEVGEVPGLTFESLGGVFRDTELAGFAVQINDRRTDGPAEKEKQLLELFKDTIYELEFVGEYA